MQKLRHAFVLERRLERGWDHPMATATKRQRQGMHFRSLRFLKLLLEVLVQVLCFEDTRRRKYIPLFHSNMAGSETHNAVADPAPYITGLILALMLLCCKFAQELLGAASSPIFCRTPVALQNPPSRVAVGASEELLEIVVADP